MDQAAFLLILLTGIFDIPSSVPRKFYYVNELKTWQDAQTYCRANYVDLATIDSAADVAVAQATLQDMAAGYTGAVWIGLRRKWIWSTGDPFTYTPVWGVYQPNEGPTEAACLVLFSGEWGDYYCSTSFPFYCYDDSPTASNKYILIQSSKNWTDAQAYCKQQYTDLAVANTAADAAQLSGTGWIGLISSLWSDGAFSSYRNWGPGSSESSVIDKCGSMSLANAAKWAGKDCSLMLPFLCYGVLHVGPQIAPRQYHYVDYQMTWTDAQTYCKSKFTDLASLDSINDVNRLMNEAALGYSGSLWIGLNRSSQALWVWSRGDDLLGNYYNWDAGMPNGAGKCAANVNKFWHDYNCNALLYFVCYYEGTGYIMVQSNKTWLDAHSYCLSTYTDLASVRSPWEQTQLLSLVGKGATVWIGLFQDSWMWSEQRGHFFKNWAENQPSATSGDCTTIVTSNSGKWSVQNCNTALPFVCYADKKVMKKTLIRIKLSHGGTANLNDPVMQTTILKEIEIFFIAWRRATFGSLRWNVMGDANVFVKIKVVNSEKGICLRSKMYGENFFSAKCHL